MLRWSPTPNIIPGYDEDARVYFDVNKPLPLGHQSTGWEMGETPAIICSLYDLFIKILNSPPILRPVPTKEMQLFCKYLQAFNQQPSYICAESKNDDGYEIADHFHAGWMNGAILVAHCSHRTLQHTIRSLYSYCHGRQKYIPSREGQRRVLENLSERETERSWLY